MINEVCLKLIKVNKRSNNSIIYIYCLLLSFVFLLICTKTSPLYPTNDWVDSNAFFTMGKGMMNDKILYRDLFEQKGPLLYLLHGLAYLISNTTFLGVFIFEVISFSFFLVYAHKLILLFLDIKYSIISLPLITVMILNMRNFTHGDSAEEFCMPLITISLYYLTNYFKNTYPNPVSKKSLFINGIIAGCVLWIKFSLLGFWFGWMASMFFCMIVNKNYLQAIKSCFIFLFGMFIATMPWIFYFEINSSVLQWLYCYFYVNINYYPEDGSFLSRVQYILLQLIANIVVNPAFAPLFISGLFLFIKRDKFIKSSFNRACLGFCIICLLLGVYGGGLGYIYYFLIFSPFVILGFIVLMDFINIGFSTKVTSKTSIIAVIISLIITFPLTLLFNHNTYFLKINKDNLVQYKFASVINKTKNATLLNYGSLDFGFYTTANITPNIRFFEDQNIDYSKLPLIMDEQNRYIKDKEIDYVVIGQEASQSLAKLNIPYLYDNYSLIMEDTQMYQDKEYIFLLFKLK